MTTRIMTLLVLWFALSPSAGAHECGVHDTPLFDLLMEYTETHGTYFVVDPRARRVVVNLSGVETASINPAKLVSILNTHGLTARTKGEFVYIALVPEADTSIEEIGI